MGSGPIAPIPYFISLLAGRREMRLAEAILFILLFILSILSILSICGVSVPLARAGPASRLMK